MICTVDESSAIELIPCVHFSFQREGSHNIPLYILERDYRVSSVLGFYGGQMKFKVSQSYVISVILK